jgi:hypothetical protein
MLMERAAAPKAQECYGRSSKKEASRHAAPDARERVPTCAVWLSRLHRAAVRLDRLQLWPAFSEVAQVIPPPRLAWRRCCESGRLYPQARERDGWPPSRNWPSHCFKCRHAPTECTPMRNNAPPPVDFQSLENTEFEPEWFSSARSSRIEPLEAAISRRIFSIGGA